MTVNIKKVLTPNKELKQLARDVKNYGKGRNRKSGDWRKSPEGVAHSKYLASLNKPKSDKKRIGDTADWKKSPEGVAHLKYLEGLKKGKRPKKDLVIEKYGVLVARRLFPRLFNRKGK